MKKKVCFGDAAWVWNFAIRASLILVSEKSVAWSGTIVFELTKKFRRFLRLVLAESSLSIDQVDQTIKLGPKAKRYLRNTKRWLVRQDHRLVSN